MILKAIKNLGRYNQLIFLAGLGVYGTIAVRYGWDLTLAAPIGVVLSIAVLSAMERLAPNRPEEKRRPG